MAKIKQKKQLNLPQLIEWAWDNNVKNERYRCSDSNPYEYVWINENSDVELDEDMCISKNDTFTVEVEEEITEDTVFEYLINVYRGNGTFMELDTNECINEYNVANLIEVHAYIDGEFKLIWTHEKGLVE